MERLILPVRPDWAEKCKAQGLYICDATSTDGTPYWSDGVSYKFTATEIDQLEEATDQLHAMCMELVKKIVESGDYPDSYGLSGSAKSLIERSWREKWPHLYGRFDLAFDGSTIKMLEYNADTPTGLVEAAVAQWYWLEDRQFPDQFNSIHDKLVDRWKIIAPELPSNQVHFLSSKDGGKEDWSTVEYLMQTALDAGIKTSQLAIGDLGWDKKNRDFVDLNDQPINCAFKLYPWEWMFAERSGQSLPHANTRWVEPAWKALLSSKVLLPLLWQMFPNHPLLLASHIHIEGNLPSSGKWVKKPIYAREGANVSLVENGIEVALSGSHFMPHYDKHGYVLQKWVDLPAFDNNRPIIGSWVIGDESAGIGIREELDNLVTGNCSHFAPHYFAE